VRSAQDGARFNSGNRRQTYEPTPLGFAIQNTDPAKGTVGSDVAESPAWDVDAGAVQKAGGKVLASAVEPGAAGSAPDYGRAAMGEIPGGRGQVRFLGALLPQPSEAFDHDFGIEPYAVTYTGWILFCNMLGADCRARGSATAGGPTACPSNAGFAKAKATPKGRRVRMAFTRRLGRRATVDVFQVSHGRRVLKERLVARFGKRKRGFTWNGRANRKGRRVTDGVFFVRSRTRFGKLVDTRRTVLRRSKGRFARRPPFHRRSTCGTLESFKLQRAVFGGTQRVPLRIAYRLKRRASVKVRVLRGKKVVKSFEARTAKGRQDRPAALPGERRAPWRPPRADHGHAREPAHRGRPHVAEAVSARRPSITARCSASVSARCRLSWTDGASPRRSMYQGWNLRR